MKLQQPDAPVVSIELVRRYYEFSDWANERVLRLASHLCDEELDRSFEMGVGTLRKTLVHINGAERWWFANWTIGPEHAFPKADDKMSFGFGLDYYAAPVLYYLGFP